MDLKSLEDHLNSVKNAFGLIGGSIKVNPTKPSRGHISGKISTKNWETEISLDEEWDLDKPLLDRLGDSEEPMLEVSSNLVYNNAAHWAVCPHDLSEHLRILSNITKGLRTRKKEEYAEYVAHAFEDLVANSWCRLNLETYNGMQAFFYDQRKSNPSEKEGLMGKIRRVLSERKFSPFYEAFIKINNAAWGDKSSNALFAHYFRNKGKVTTAVDNVINSLGIRSDSLESNVEALTDKENWEEFAYDFAKELAPLIDERCKESTSGENEFEKKMHSPSNRRNLIKQAFDKGEKPAFFNGFEIALTLYELLAPKISIEAESSDEGSVLPVVPYSFEPFRPKEHSLSDMHLGKVVIDADSPFFDRINFGVPTQHHNLALPHKREHSKFPNICFIIDDSYSMTEFIDPEQHNPDSRNLIHDKRKPWRGYAGDTKFFPWGDKSKYHHALLGVFGALNWLESVGIAPYIEYNAITMTYHTRSTGWVGYGELDQLKWILLHPGFVGTVIDPDVLKKQFDDKDGNVIVTLSDGEIFNWNEVARVGGTGMGESGLGLPFTSKKVAPIRNVVQDIVERNQVSHIQLGMGHQKPQLTERTCSDLEYWGAKVHRITQHSDLSRLIIKVTEDKMKQYL